MTRLSPAELAGLVARLTSYASARRGNEHAEELLALCAAVEALAEDARDAALMFAAVIKVHSVYVDQRSLLEADVALLRRDDNADGGTHWWYDEHNRVPDAARATPKTETEPNV